MGPLREHLAGRQSPQRVRGGPPSLVSQLIVVDSPIIQQVMAEQTSANVFLLRKWDFRTDMTKWVTARLERRQMEDRSRAGCKQMIWGEVDRCNNTKGIKGGIRTRFHFTCFLCDGNTQCFLKESSQFNASLCLNMSLVLASACVKKVGSPLKGDLGKHTDPSFIPGCLSERGGWHHLKAYHRERFRKSQRYGYIKPTLDFSADRLFLS